jgi:hypothetical protein
MADGPKNRQPLKTDSDKDVTTASSFTARRTGKTGLITLSAHAANHQDTMRAVFLLLLTTRKFYMKNQSVKTAVLSTLLLAAAGFSQLSSAHTASGTLAATASNIDVYHTSCFSWGTAPYTATPAGEVTGAADRLVGSVQKDSGTGTVKISLGKIGLSGAGVSASDATIGGAASAFSALNNGNGDYVFAISHTTAVANNYTASIHCEKFTAGGVTAPAGSGDHTGTGVGTDGAGGTAADFIQIINQ